MHLVIADCNRNAAHAVRTYREKHPKWRVPNHYIFLSADCHLEDGNTSQNAMGHGCPHSLHNVWMEAQILEVGEDIQPAVCTGISHTPVHLTLQEQQVNAYHIQSLQELVPHITPARCALSMVDSATVDQMPYVYSEGSIHEKIMIH
jgi:hypothetical protein